MFVFASFLLQYHWIGHSNLSNSIKHRLISLLIIHPNFLLLGSLRLFFGGGFQPLFFFGQQDLDAGGDL